MLCRKPYSLGAALPVGCGQCLPCRISRRRLWADRQVLESMCHGDTIFVTLTYDDKYVPTNEEGAQCLDPEDVRLFFGRLRKRVGYRAFRYFGCGEYGPQTWRPHYHFNLFGLNVLARNHIQDAWGMGFVTVQPFATGTAQYVAGYVVKKMTSTGDWRLDGRTPEFARMSRNPGIGAPALKQLAQHLWDNTGWDIVRQKDVPMSVRVDGKLLRLGRYLREQLRTEFHMPEDWRSALKQEWIDETQAKLYAMWAPSKEAPLTAVLNYVEASMGKIQSVEGKAKLRRKETL